MNKIIHNIILSLLLMINVSICYSQQSFNLDEVIKIAIENNQQIKSARLNIEKEESVKLKSFNVPKPELFIEYEGVKGSLKNYESRKIGILQELEFPANYFLRSDVQSSQVQVVRQELNQLVNNLKADVKTNYFKLLLSIKLLEIAGENLMIYDEFLLVAQRKYDAGSASNLEVLGAKVNKIKFENEIRNLESEIKVAQSELKKLMNVSYEIIPAEELTYKELILSKRELLTAALINNPELKIINFQKEKFSNKLSLSRSELLPGLSFRYYRQKIGDNADFWGMELGLGIPLWFWWEPTGSIKESSYELQIAVSDEINIKKSIENIVNQSFVEYENSLRQLKFFRDEANIETGEIFRQAKISYEEGAIGYVEYLQALEIVYDTKIQYLNAVYNYNNSLLNLEKITAGDLK